MIKKFMLVCSLMVGGREFAYVYQPTLRKDRG